MKMPEDHVLGYVPERLNSISSHTDRVRTKDGRVFQSPQRATLHSSLVIVKDMMELAVPPPTRVAVGVRLRGPLIVTFIGTSTSLSMGHSST
jgi:hypothetical protein